MTDTEENIRPMVTIQEIKELNPIEGADRIDVATILGWKVVVKKGEFHTGELCAFFEVGSVLPRKEWSEFLFKAGSEDKTVRLKTIRLKKQLSQGLALRPEALGFEFCELNYPGEDLTSTLGVTKYSPPCDKGSGDLRAKSTRPHWVYKTDETRVQNIPWILDYMRGKGVYITKKLDGSSCSVGNHPEYGKVICSRNMSLDIESDNRFTQIGKPILDRLPVGYVVQGEIVGPGIQGNRLGLNEFQFFAFNIWDVRNRGDMEYGPLLSFVDFDAFCREYKIQRVPTVFVGEFKWDSVDQLLALAALQKYDNGHPAEGIVIRPVIPEWHNKIGMLSFKVINNEFLLKIGE